MNPSNKENVDIMNMGVVSVKILIQVDLQSWIVKLTTIKNIFNEIRL